MEITIYHPTERTIPPEGKETTETSPVGRGWSKVFGLDRLSDGFTLIELILVLFLVGLIATLTTPFLFSTLDRIKNQSSIREITSTLRYARSQAISQKVAFAFNADIDNNQFWLTNLETDETTKTIAINPKIRIAEFADEEENVTDGLFLIVFYPQGNSSGGTMRLEPTGRDPEAKIHYISLDRITGKPNVEQEPQ
ncbi:MAG: GspH/FimT family pseudopilin [Nitrospinales bacterium]